MTVTKVASAILGALLIFLVGKWAAEALYHVGGHGDPAYVIETEEPDAPAEEEVELSLGEMLAQADAGKGEKVFKKCAACHKLEEGANATGPYLYGVVDRPIASVAGFGYSDVLAGMGGDWTPEALDEFLHKPSEFAPGTKMTFSGLSKADDRANVIAFLNENSASPVDFAAAAPAEEPAAEEPAAEEPAAEEPEAEAPAEQETAPEPAEAADAGDKDEPATDAEPAEAPEAAETPAAEAPADEAPADTAEAPAATEAAPEQTAAIAGDVEKGKKVFKKCAACHKLEEGKNVVGPSLFGVVGRSVASIDGFKYSSALTDLGGEWTPERLDGYLAKPRDFAPGNKMTFSGLSKEEDRQNVIAYLNSIGG
ncbi:MAG: c-type cytochrome [Jhaorihella sp.]